MIEQKEHNANCTKYLKQWIFTFDDGEDTHTETYYGNTEEDAKKDMLKWYKDAVEQAEKNGIEFSVLFDGLTKMEPTGEYVKFG